VNVCHRCTVSEQSDTRVNGESGGGGGGGGGGAGNANGKRGRGRAPRESLHFDCVTFQIVPFRSRAIARRGGVAERRGRGGEAGGDAPWDRPPSCSGRFDVMQRPCAREVRQPPASPAPACLGI